MIDTVQNRPARRRRLPADAAFDGPKDYFLGAWRMLRQDLWLVVFKLLATLVRWAMSLGAIAAIAVAVWLVVRRAFNGAAGLDAALAALVDRLGSPGFVVGAAGVLFGSWLVGEVVDVVVASGIWGSLADALAGRRIERFKTFADHAPRHVAPVLNLRVASLASKLVMGLLAVMVVAGNLVATTGDGMLASTPVWVRGVVWATSLTALIGLTAMIGLTMQVAAAAVIVDRRTLADALRAAATIVVDHLARLYRLVVVASGLLAIPLALYWAALLVHNIAVAMASDAAGMVALASAFRLLAGAILLVGIGVVSILLDGAIFIFYEHSIHGFQMASADPSDDDNRQDDDESRLTESRSTGAPVSGAPVSGPVGMPTAPPSGDFDFDDNPALEDLLPKSYPNIRSIDDVLTSRGDDTFDSDDVI